MPSGTLAPAACEPAGPEGAVLAVVPCYNVGGACVPVLEGALRHLEHVIAVDDGSTDDTPLHLARVGVPVLTHSENRGKGAALLTAFRWAVERGYGAVLTLDGDGQHRPDDIPALLGAFEPAAPDLVIGVRSVHWRTAPFRSWVGNTLSGRLFSWITGTGILDCQSGFRLYSARFLERVLPRLRPGRYETEMELLLAAAREPRGVTAVPVQTIYDAQSRRLSHFDPCRDSARIAASIGRGLWGRARAGGR